MRSSSFWIPFALVTTFCTIAQATAWTEMDLQANYCLAALHMQDEMAQASKRPRDIDMVLGSTAKTRAVKRALLEAYLAGRGLSATEAESARSKGASRLAPDVTALIFAAPAPDCRYIAKRTCIADAWARSGALARQAPCLGDLAWLKAFPDSRMPPPE